MIGVAAIVAGFVLVYHGASSSRSQYQTTRVKHLTVALCGLVLAVAGQSLLTYLAATGAVWTP